VNTKLLFRRSFSILNIRFYLLLLWNFGDVLHFIPTKKLWNWCICVSFMSCSRHSSKMLCLGISFILIKPKKMWHGLLFLKSSKSNTFLRHIIIIKITKKKLEVLKIYCIMDLPFPDSMIWYFISRFKNMIIECYVLSSNVILRPFSWEWLWTPALPWWYCRDLITDIYNVPFMDYFLILANILTFKCLNHDQMSLSQETCQANFVALVWPVFSYHSLGELWLGKKLGSGVSVR
jgi:hypothetical protein